MGFLEMVRSAYARRASRPEESAGEGATLDRPPKCAAAADTAAADKKQRRQRQAARRWRPSLGAISENAVFRAIGDAAEGERRAGARAPKKRSALTLANAVARARGGWGSSSRAFAAQQTAVPALASAPFWF